MHDKDAALNAVHDKSPNDYRSKVLVTFSNTTVFEKNIILKNCLIKILNEDNHETTLNKNNIYSQSFFTFKVTLKINKINSYSDKCNIRDCNICKMDQENE